jgi:hypothetical protein
VLAQQGGRGIVPLRAIRARRLRGAQALRVALEAAAQIGNGVGGVAVQLRLHLLDLVPPRQPHHRDQQHRHQHREQQPQEPALPQRAAQARERGARPPLRCDGQQRIGHR